jgi:hypothetical protein
VEFSIGNLPEGQANPGSLSVEVVRYAFGGCSCDNCAVIDADLSVLSDNGYNVMGGWRVGQATV